MITLNTHLNLLAKAVQPTHAPTLEQVEEMISGKVKSPVRLVSTNNLVGDYADKVFTASANGELVIDSISVSTGDRVLLAGQTDKTQNGVYSVTNSGGAAAPFVITRASDFDSSSDIFAGVKIAVTEGTSNKDTTWYLATDNPIVLDSTSLDFAVDFGQISRLEQHVFEMAGDDATTEYTFSHNFGTKNVMVQVHNSATGEVEIFDIRKINGNDVIIGMAVPLGVGNDYTVIVQGKV